jgi:WD40 repeat protein
VDLSVEGSMVFEYLSHPVHSSAITGISTCVRKPLMATSSMDQTVRIWNYLERSCVLVKHFSEEVNVSKCFKMFQFLFHIFSKSFKTVSKISQNVSKCFKIVSKCFKMFQHVSKCFKMFQNVSKCFKMFQNVSQWLQVHSVTLHPSGIHVAVGFADKLRIMNILDNDIRAYAEFPVKVCENKRRRMIRIIKLWLLSQEQVCDTIKEEDDDPAGWVVNGKRNHAGRQGELVPRGHNTIYIYDNQALVVVIDTGV